MHGRHKEKVKKDTKSYKVDRELASTGNTTAIAGCTTTPCGDVVVDGRYWLAGWLAGGQTRTWDLLIFG